jgi:hypothetical protein
MVLIKGQEIETVIFKNAHNRRAMQLKNNIFKLLIRIGVNSLALFKIIMTKLHTKYIN